MFYLEQIVPPLEWICRPEMSQAKKLEVLTVQQVDFLFLSIFTCIFPFCVCLNMMMVMIRSI